MTFEDKKTPILIFIIMTQNLMILVPNFSIGAPGNARIYQASHLDANNNAVLNDLLQKLNNAQDASGAKGTILKAADVEKALKASGLDEFYTAQYTTNTATGGHNRGDFITEETPVAQNNSNAYTVVKGTRKM
ncbi:hypothetical protein FEZ41_14305 [Lentilactobacillus parafarraginis]|uniref:Uncharacterized protein n=1 Tax=Lentilactobacillus parafarraginis TaxID=390842 RepID=A0A5R9CFH7_9LACO|nr:hypothetical protein [Lentilactobacillus parafarraginis]TLQ13980.1 hypothetical protein FEZ41_14305 [Lentilactobacillus parafarraginis]